jgi:spermidine synthase
MKPRITLAEATLPDGTVLELHEHDGRKYLQHGSVQLAGPVTRASERELGRIACAPFRPARQPKIWIVGLGLGEVLAGAMETLPQKRGTFFIGEPWKVVAEWHRKYIPESPAVTDPRVEILSDVGATAFHEYEEALHAVLIHSDTAPLGERGRALFEDRRWLAGVHGALQSGGLLGIGSSRPLPMIERNLARAGFEVVRHEIDASPNARRSRRHFLWLARKGKSGE